MGLSLPHGGHLSHGMKINVSGRLYDIAPYEVDRETSLIDMDEVERIAKERRPKLLLAGWSAYPRQLDFARFRAIADEVGALLMVDMAHFAGLVAAGLHPNPVPHADVVTSTVHKTLGGARGGLILCKEEHAKKPSTRRSSPASRAARWSTSSPARRWRSRSPAATLFRERQERTIAGAQAVAEALMSAGHGVNVLTGGTDVHLALVDLRESEIDGQQAEDRLHDIGITVNRNAVPVRPAPADGHPRPARRHARAGDPRPAGRRLRRGRRDHRHRADARLRRQARRAGRARRRAIAERYPLYEQLSAGATV